MVCRHAREGEKQSPDANPRDAILILIVTRGNIEANDSDTYEVLEHLETTGHIATSGPHVRFSKLRVPERNLLAAPGKGADTISGAFTGTAAWVGAMATGIMRAAFEAALKFSKEDSRGGSTPILNRQSVADLLMNIKMRTDASRLLTWQACRAFEKGLGPELPLEAKIYCSDNAVKCVVDAMNAVGM